ncbi:hypothetical protein [Micromonospora sp. WMMD1274]|uniref:hypothetical protein n=1 Tax=Micromonospora sp. WMMD1274 TaxID=3404116 RepID=UPI003B941EF0
MTSHAIGPGRGPESRRWLARQFPHRSWLIADLQRRIDRAPAPIHAYPPNPDRFGQALERTLALDLCDDPPYPYLIAKLPEAGRRRLLTAAGYTPTTCAADGPWRKTTDHIPGARLFTVGNLLPDLDRAVHALGQAAPDPIGQAIHAAVRDRRTITTYATATHAARPAFAAFWASYTSGFRDTLRGYGPVTASLNLLDGLRIVDFLAGTTTVELKTGHLDDARAFDALIDQVLTYALLAPVCGHPVTAAAIYLARYHVLAHYTLDSLLRRLAGQPINTLQAGRHLTALIRAEGRRPLPAGLPPEGRRSYAV